MKTLIPLLFIFLLAGCKKDEIGYNGDPHKAILGKWEQFYHGNGEDSPSIKNPAAYQEFLPDSVLLEYDYATKTTYNRKYWIDSLLHTGSLREDGYWLTFDYYYKFENNNILRLDVANSTAIFYVSKYKRIK